MTEYEILGNTPTGIKVAVYHNDKELFVVNVPSGQCQSKVMLESWLKKQAGPKIQEWKVPAAVQNIKGRQTLSMD